MGFEQINRQSFDADGNLQNARRHINFDFITNNAMERINISAGSTIAPPDTLTSRPTRVAFALLMANDDLVIE